MSPKVLTQNITETGDSLLHLLKTSTSSDTKIRLYRNLADLYLDEPQAKEYLFKMYQEASKINNRKSMLEALNDIIIIEANAYNKDSVVKYTGFLKKVATPQELKSMLPLYHLRIFDSLIYTAKKEEAIEEELSFLNSQTDSTSANPYREMVSNYIMGGSLYMNRQYEKALPYINKAMKVAESLPADRRYEYQKFISWRLCYAYARCHQEKNAIQIMEHLINMVEQEYKTDYQKQRPFFKVELFLLQYYSFMITCVQYLTPEQARHYWNRIQLIRPKLTNDMDKYNYYLCAKNYYSSNPAKMDLEKAIIANDSLIKFAQTLAPQNLPGLYKNNSAFYETIQNYPKALEYLKTSHLIYDSLNTDAARKQFNELQVKYDLNTLNNEKAMLEVRNKSNQLISLSILLIVLVSVCTYLYFSLKKERRMKIQLKILHKKAQESEMMKQSFINSICHEIRTPLNAIVGFSDLIMNEEIDEELRREFPCEIQKSTLLLTNLVNSMLEVASLDVSDEKLPCTPTDLHSICTQEMERLNPKVGIAYKLNIPNESFYISTNGQYLSQVIAHLLENANKFTDKGSITLSYTADETLRVVTLLVSDTGCGIPISKHNEVFDRFTKLDSFAQGNGLGLYLCRLIMKRLGGEIRIATDYTAGSRLIVTLPME